MGRGADPLAALSTYPGGGGAGAGSNNRLARLPAKVITVDAQLPPPPPATHSYHRIARRPATQTG